MDQGLGVHAARKSSKRKAATVETQGMGEGVELIGAAVVDDTESASKKVKESNGDDDVLLEDDEDIGVSCCVLERYNVDQHHVSNMLN